MRGCLPPAGFFQFRGLPGWGNPSGFLGKPRGSEAFSSPGQGPPARKFRFSGTPGASVFPLPACGNLRAVERDGSLLPGFFRGRPAPPGFSPLGRRTRGPAELRSVRILFSDFPTGFPGVFHRIRGGFSGGGEEIRVFGGPREPFSVGFASCGGGKLWFSTEVFP